MEVKGELGGASRYQRKHPKGSKDKALNRKYISKEKSRSQTWRLKRNRRIGVDSEHQC